MLRIDETSKTLMAPQEGGFVPEPPPARDELLHLLAGGWQAFAGEIGQTHVRYLAHTMEPGVDMLAIDESGSRVVVVLVGESGRELLGRALLAGAVVAGWGADELSAMNPALASASPDESPRLILVATDWDEPTVAALAWLSRKHAMEINGYQVGMIRFGSERMLTVEPAGAAASAPAAADPAAQFFAHMQPQAAEPAPEPAPAPEPVAEPVSSVPPPVAAA